MTHKEFSALATLPSPQRKSNTKRSIGNLLKQLRISSSCHYLLFTCHYSRTAFCLISLWWSSFLSLRGT